MMRNPLNFLLILRFNGYKKSVKFPDFLFSLCDLVRHLFYLIAKLKCDFIYYISQHKNNMVQSIAEYQHNYYKNNKFKIEEKRLEKHLNNPSKRQQQQKSYYDLNAVRLIERQKEYNKINADSVKNYQAEYYKKNKERLDIMRQNYRDENAVEIKERQQVKVICECGCELLKVGLKRHQTTKKHIDLMKLKECVVIKKKKKKRKRLVIID